jgi:hypothetical protein
MWGKLRVAAVISTGDKEETDSLPPTVTLVVCMDVRVETGLRKSVPNESVRNGASSSSSLHYRHIREEVKLRKIKKEKLNCSKSETSHTHLIDDTNFIRYLTQNTPLRHYNER